MGTAAQLFDGNLEDKCLTTNMMKKILRDEKFRNLCKEKWQTSFLFLVKEKNGFVVWSIRSSRYYRNIRYRMNDPLVFDPVWGRWIITR